MIKMRCVLAVGMMLLPAVSSVGQEHVVEMIEQGPAAEDVGKDLLSQFAKPGYRVNRGTRTVAEIWFNKDLQVAADFEPSPERLYPFQPGQLIGLLHFPRRGSDFRDQSISSGWYTLRFALQPVDGNHIGTSPTRDFFVLVAVENDEVGKEWPDDELQVVSAEAAGSAHPAMLCLQPPIDNPKPAMRHQEEQDWWILHVPTEGVADGKKSPIAIDVVVAGHAAE